MAATDSAKRLLSQPVGRDEMNLAEFPIALLSNRAQNQKTIVYEGKSGRLTISGTDKFGLPTALDQDVIIGLLQLTKRANNFTDPTVNFTRYELLKVIRWPNESKYYERLIESLNRWSGVKLYYENCWWDNKKKTRVNAALGILESFVMYDRSGQTSVEIQSKEGFPFSTFIWNKTFFRSCQDNNLKKLNLDVYFGLESSITKQLYRLLDKRFYQSPTQIFDLNELAFFHVGLSPNYSSAKIKEKLAGPLDELEQIGFIEPATKAERYSRVRHGEWSIILKRKSASQELSVKLAMPSSSPIVQELVDRDVTSSTAEDLSEAYSAEAIRAQLEAFDWLVSRQDKRVAKSPAGYLVKSILKGYNAPKGFKTKAQMVQEAEANRLVRLHEDEARRRKSEQEAQEKLRRQEESVRIDVYLSSLSEKERIEIEIEALAGMPAFAKGFRNTLIRDFVGRMIGLYSEA
jgi:hypothetical protein